LTQGAEAQQETYLAECREHVRRLTGKSPEGAPLLLEAYLRAYNQDLQPAVLRHGYLVEVPLEHLPARSTKGKPDTRQTKQ
jgi:hypothetical protein